jgi:DNA repair ATPase RecN
MAVTIIDVNGEARGKELARMTSGDMATEEVRQFADALLREREEYISTGRKVSETY